MTDYINKVDAQGNYITVYGEVDENALEVLPDYGFPVLKSLKLRSSNRLLKDLHDRAVTLDDDKLFFLIGDVADRIKELEAKLHKYKTKFDHIKRAIDVNL